MSSRDLSKTLKELDEVLIQWKNEYHLAGLAAGVVQDGELVYVRGFGQANIQEDLPVTADTVFRIGSISKTFTAIGVMQLYEQGRFDLDDPVNQHLKSYQVKHRDPGAPPVTIRHMLTHTSGIGETRNLPGLIQTLLGKLEIALEADDPIPDLGEYYKGELQPEVFPEQKWAYANHAFATLGQLIEDVSGQPLDEYMIEHVFEPLGMFKTDFMLSERVKEGLAKGYAFKKGKFIELPYKKVLVSAAGSVFSSVNEMAAYMAALMKGGENPSGRILKEETLRQMWKNQLRCDPAVFGFGLSWFLPAYEDVLVINHDGGWPGFVSSMFVAPDEKLGVIIFTNTASRAPNLIASDIMHRLLGQKNPLDKLPLPAVLENVHEYSRLCGYYGTKPGLLTNLRPWSMFGNEIEICIRDNKLTLRSLAGPLSRGTRLLRSDPDNPHLYQAKGLSGKDVLTIEFREDAVGEIMGLDLGLNVNQTSFYKHTYVQSLRFRTHLVGGLLATGLLLLGGRKLLKKKK